MTLRVLLVEGNGAEAGRIVRAVADERLAIEWATSGSAALCRLDEPWAALIVGEPLQTPAAPALIAAARRLGFDRPIVALLRQADLLASRELLEAGAYDVLIRTSGYELLLARLLLRALEQAALRRQVDHLRHQAVGLARELARSRPSDPLTGLPAGWYLDARRKDERRRAVRTGRALTTVTVRLTTADDSTRRLIRLADVLRQQSRASDVVGRAGPDRFLVLLPETPVPGAWAWIQRLTAALELAGERAVGYTVEAEPDVPSRLRPSA